MPSLSLQDVTKELRDAYLALSADFKAQNPGKQLVITCTARSAEEQLACYAQGRALRDGHWVVEDASKIVTQLSGLPGSQSLHNKKPAEALDVVVTVGGKWTWDYRAFLPLGPLAAKHGLKISTHIAAGTLSFDKSYMQVLRKTGRSEVQGLAQSISRNEQVSIKHGALSLIRVQKTCEHEPLDRDDGDVPRGKSFG